jgi:hypothetical protein
MKTWFIIAVVLIIPIQAREKNMDDLARELQGKADLEQEQAWRSMAPREILIEGLLKEYQSALTIKDYYAATEATKRLVVLEHAETIQQLIESLQRGPYGGNPVEGSPTETTIPYLIPLLLGGATIPDPVFDSGIRGDLTARDRAALAIVHAIRRRTVFPDETRQWAHNMYRALPFPMREQRVNLVKQWWEHNKHAMEERRYADATWLPPKYKGEASYLSFEEMNELKAKQAQNLNNRRAPDSIDPAATASSKKTAEAPAASETKRPTGQAIGILLAALFTIVATVVWKLKRTPVKS